MVDIAFCKQSIVLVTDLWLR